MSIYHYFQPSALLYGIMASVLRMELFRIKLGQLRGVKTALDRLTVPSVNSPLV